MSKAPTFTIAGREYGPIAPPLRADHRLYLAGELAATGLDQARETFQRASSATQGARDLFIHAAQSGRLPWLVAGFLAETGRGWSRATALETAERFAGLTAPADLAAFDGAVAATILALIGAFGDPPAIELDALAAALAQSSARTSHTLN